MERLDLDLIRDIVYRLRNSHTERAIARDLRLARETVRHYHAIARHSGIWAVGYRPASGRGGLSTWHTSRLRYVNWSIGR